jgi:glutathione S-transferase
MADVTLRYFPIAGRAHALRRTLADAGVAFDDVFVTLEKWPSHREDAAFAGPFASLPTLTWGGEDVAETLPIAFYLARRLGQYDGKKAAAIARLEAIASSAYTDGMSGIAQLVWSDMVYPGADPVLALPRVLGRTLGKLARLDALSPEQGFFGGVSPCIADFFVVEALEAHRHLLGPARDGALRARVPRLFALAERVAARPAVARLGRPERFTGRPDEPALLERLRAVDLASLGL